MKKMKNAFCVIVLSTFMAGNVLAGDFTDYKIVSIFGDAIDAVVSMFGIAQDPCEGRICSNCKPTSNDKSENNCRPTE